MDTHRGESVKKLVSVIRESGARATPPASVTGEGARVPFFACEITKKRRQGVYKF